MRQRRCDVLFIAYGSVLRRSGYSARVLSELRALCAAQAPLRLALLSFEAELGADQQNDRRLLLEEELEQSGVKTRYVFFPIAASSLLSKLAIAILVEVQVLIDVVRYRPHVIHVEGHAAGYRALMPAMICRVPLVLDIHGAAVDEHRYLHPRQSRWILGAMRLAEKLLIARSSSVVCVSRAMQEHYSLGRSAKRAVIPCCVNTAAFALQPFLRDQVRAELDVAERTVVAYNGSFFDAWQEPTDIIATFRSISKHLAKPCLLVLTTDEPGTVAEYLVSRGLKASDFRVRSLPYSEVPRYLAAADLGLLIRRHSVVNFVASPTKFAEYLAAGVPVVISEGVGDYTSLAHSTGTGMVWRGSKRAEASASVGTQLLELLKSETRRRCRVTAQSLLDWGRFVPVLLDLYAAASPSLGRRLRRIRLAPPP